MMGIVLRRATDKDWHVFLGIPAPAVWYGMVAENSYMLIGIGGAYLGSSDRWWATFQRAPGVTGHRLTAQKAAKTTIEIADGMKIDLHAIADTEIDRSEYWLERLGFERTGEEEKGWPIWARKSR